MQAKFQGALAVALAAVVTLGCGSSSSTTKVQTASAQPEPVAPPAPVVVPIDAGTPVEAEVLAPPTIRERRILEYIPSEYDLVLHLSLDKLLDSEFFRRHEKALLVEVEDERENIIKKCQLDPMSDFDSLTLAVNLSTSDPEVLFALSTPMGASRIDECVRAAGGKSEAGAYTIDGDDIGFYWPSEDVVLLSGDKSSEEIRYALRTGRALDNPGLMEFLSRTDRHATMWGAGIVPPALASSMNGFGGVPRGFVVRGSAWAGIDLSAELVFDSRDEADKMMNLLKMGLSTAGQDPPFNDLLDSIDTEQIGTSITIDAHISPKLAGELVDEF